MVAKDSEIRARCYDVEKRMIETMADREGIGYTDLLRRLIYEEARRRGLWSPEMDEIWEPAVGENGDQPCI